MGADAGADAYADASPITHVSDALPPIMLLHSNLDVLVPRRQSLDMYDALVAAGVPTELHMYDGAPHDFDSSPALGREAARLVVSFVQRHVAASD
jgi:dipeptidyl aminopeptidase/acylaminoacyl peptidase